MNKPLYITNSGDYYFIVKDEVNIEKLTACGCKLWDTEQEMLEYSAEKAEVDVEMLEGSSILVNGGYWFDSRGVGSEIEEDSVEKFIVEFEM